MKSGVLSNRFAKTILIFTLVAGLVLTGMPAAAYGTDTQNTGTIQKQEQYDAVIIAKGLNSPGDFSDSCLATTSKAPVLSLDIVSDEKIKEFIETKLKEGGRVYLLGDEDVLPLACESELKARGFNVKRLNGDSRFSSNVVVLKEALVLELSEKTGLENLIEADKKELASLNENIPKLEETMNTSQATAAETKKPYDVANGELTEAEEKVASNSDADMAKLREELDKAKAATERIDLKTRVEQANAKLAEAKDKYSKVGWNFLNSKVTSGNTIEDWIARAKSYSTTSGTASSGAFSSNIAQATTPGNLRRAADYMDQCNSIRASRGLGSLSVDYNLMTSGAVSASLISANSGLVHSYAYGVISRYYGPWDGENLAWSGSAGNPFAGWYYAEADGDPHRANILSGSSTQGIGYVAGGCAQEFGTGSSVSVSVAQFRNDLAAYEAEAKKAVEDAQKEVDTVNQEVAKLEGRLAEAKTEYVNAGKAGGCDNIGTLYDTMDAARTQYKLKYSDYRVNKDNYDNALERRAELEEEIAGSNERLALLEEAIDRQSILEDEKLVQSASPFTDSLVVSDDKKPVLLTGATVNKYRFIIKDRSFDKVKDKAKGGGKDDKVQ
ncbi:MAG: hypothetical protein HUJ78_01540 [Mogibacterium sp.]|nr:hypothetical protein [Mogibacterium sp.]